MITYKPSIPLNASKNISKSSVSYQTQDKYIQVPLCRQATSYTCGPAALQSVLGYYGEEFQEDYLAKMLHTRPVVGTDFREILRFCNQHNYKTLFQEQLSIDSIKQQIDYRQPCILLIQAWSDYPIDYACSHDNGHYVVVCGYSDSYFIIMDPSTLGCYTYLTYDELLTRWHFRDDYGDYIKSCIIIECIKTVSILNTKRLKHLG